LIFASAQSTAPGSAAGTRAYGMPANNVFFELFSDPPIKSEIKKQMLNWLRDPQHKNFQVLSVTMNVAFAPFEQLGQRGSQPYWTGVIVYAF
jgi:hypothetical protein